MTEQPAEPQRSRWRLDRLPADIVPYTAHPLGEIAHGNRLSTVGWSA
ncbi:hypothetical protein ACFV1W_13645 [Kitasatospora sp. NPDC059648]